MRGARREQLVSLRHIMFFLTSAKKMPPRRSKLASYFCAAPTGGGVGDGKSASPDATPRWSLHDDAALGDRAVSKKFPPRTHSGGGPAVGPAAGKPSTRPAATSITAFTLNLPEVPVGGEGVGGVGVAAPVPADAACAPDGATMPSVQQPAAPPAPPAAPATAKGGFFDKALAGAPKAAPAAVPVDAPAFATERSDGAEPAEAAVVLRPPPPRPTPAASTAALLAATDADAAGPAMKDLAVALLGDAARKPSTLASASFDGGAAADGAGVAAALAAARSFTALLATCAGVALRSDLFDAPTQAVAGQVAVALVSWAGECEANTKAAKLEGGSSASTAPLSWMLGPSAAGAVITARRAPIPPPGADGATSLLRLAPGASLTAAAWLLRADQPAAWSAGASLLGLVLSPSSTCSPLPSCGGAAAVVAALGPIVGAAAGAPRAASAAADALAALVAADPAAAAALGADAASLASVCAIAGSPGLAAAASPAATSLLRAVLGGGACPALDAGGVSAALARVLRASVPGAEQDDAAACLVSAARRCPATRAALVAGGTLAAGCEVLDRVSIPALFGAASSGTKASLAAAARAPSAAAARAVCDALALASSAPGGAAAATALAAAGGHRALVRALRGAVGDGNDTGAAAAARALAALAEAAPGAAAGAAKAGAAGALATALREGGPTGAPHAARALAALAAACPALAADAAKPGGAGGALVAMATSTTHPPHARRAAAAALSALAAAGAKPADDLAATPGALAALAAAAASSDAAVAAPAAAALGNIAAGSAKRAEAAIAAGALPALAAALAAPAHPAKVAGAAGLFSIGATRSAALDTAAAEPTLSATVAMLDSASWYARIAAADLLASVCAGGGARAAAVAGSPGAVDALLRLFAVRHSPGTLDAATVPRVGGAASASGLSPGRGPLGGGGGVRYATVTFERRASADGGGSSSSTTPPSDGDLVMRGFKFARARLASGAALGCLAKTLAVSVGASAATALADAMAGGLAEMRASCCPEARTLAASIATDLSASGAAAAGAGALGGRGRAARAPPAPPGGATAAAVRAGGLGCEGYHVVWAASAAFGDDLAASAADATRPGSGGVLPFTDAVSAADDDAPAPTWLERVYRRISGEEGGVFEAAATPAAAAAVPAAPKPKPSVPVDSPRADDDVVFGRTAAVAARRSPSKRGVAEPASAAGVEAEEVEAEAGAEVEAADDDADLLALADRIDPRPLYSSAGKVASKSPTKAAPKPVKAPAPRPAALGAAGESDSPMADLDVVMGRTAAVSRSRRSLAPAPALPREVETQESVAAPEASPAVAAAAAAGDAAGEVEDAADLPWATATAWSPPRQQNAPAKDAAKEVESTPVLVTPPFNKASKVSVFPMKEVEAPVGVAPALGLKKASAEPAADVPSPQPSDEPAVAAARSPAKKPAATVASSADSRWSVSTSAGGAGGGGGGGGGGGVARPRTYRAPSAVHPPAAPPPEVDSPTPGAGAASATPASARPGGAHSRLSVRDTFRMSREAWPALARPAAGGAAAGSVAAGAGAPSASWAFAGGPASAGDKPRIPAPPSAVPGRSPSPPPRAPAVSAAAAAASTIPAFGTARPPAAPKGKAMMTGFSIFASPAAGGGAAPAPPGVVKTTRSDMIYTMAGLKDADVRAAEAALAASGDGGVEDGGGDVRKSFGARLSKLVGGK